MKDIRQIENLVSQYFAGIFEGDTMKLGACFHEKACLYGDIDKTLLIKSKKEYIEAVKSRKSPQEKGEKCEMKIIGIDLLGKIAMVKLRVPMLGFNYYDYLSLVKQDEKWFIVNKLYKHVSIC